MARVKAGSWGGMVVLACATALATALAGGQAWSQDTRPPRAAALLQSARECFTRGDYDGVDYFAKKAQDAGDTLTSVERTDLADLMRQNRIAVEQRRLGEAQLLQADEALRRGQAKEAATLLKALNANGYLSSSDKQQRDQLDGKLRSAVGRDPSASFPSGGLVVGAAPAPALPANADATTVVTAARAALARGDLDEAERLAVLAKTMKTGGITAIFHPFGDNPDKVLRDVEVARARQAAAAKEPANPKKESGSLLGSMTKLLPWSSTGATPASDKTDPPKAPTPQVVVAPAPVTPVTPAAPASGVDDAARTSKGILARQLIQEGYQALAKDDLVKARQLAERARDLHAELQKSDRTPEKLLADIAAHSSNRLTPASFTGTAAASAGQVVQTPAGASRSDPTEDARKLIKEGYQALHANDLIKARQLAERAQSLHPELPWYEDNPEKLMRDIDRQSPVKTGPVAQVPAPPAPTPATPPQQAKDDPHALLHQARELFTQGNLEEAEKVCNRAAAPPGTHWGLFSDSPDRLRAEIQRARSRRDHEEAVRLLAEARKKFDKGELKDAKEMAALAKQKYGPVALWDVVGDRPDKLIVEIETAEQKQRMTQAPGGTGPKPGPSPDPKTVAQVDPGPRPAGSDAANPAGGPQPAPAPKITPPPPPAVVVVPPPAPSAADPRIAQARQRILALMDASRELAKQDRLVEARAKLLEAREAAREAFKVGHRFGAQDDTPDLALSRLAAACSQKVQVLLRRADESASLGAGNAERLNDAERDLTLARQLATAFELDTRPIVEKTVRLQQLRALANDVPPPPPGVGDPGRPPDGPIPTGPVANNEQMVQRQLNDARREIEKGRLDQARKIAETAYNMASGAQQAEALNVLRSIETEEVQQQILRSKRNADAVADAYNRQDYDRARTLYNSVEVKHLSPAQQAHLREIMSMPQMQGTPVALGGGKGPAGRPGDLPGQAHVSDLGGPVATGPRGPAPNDFERLRGMEKILSDKLHQEGNQVQTKSRERFMVGDTAGALELLAAYLERLRDSQLNPDTLALLRRPIENRQQEFRTLKAQIEVATASQNAFDNGGVAREGARAKQKLIKQEKIVELMQRFQALYRDGKYNEADIVLAEAKDVDPDNVAVQVATETTRMKRRLRDIKEQRDENEKFFLEQLDAHDGPSLDIGGSMIAFDKKNADKIRNRVGLTSIAYPLHDELERKIEQKLLAPVPVNFKDVPLHKVLDDLSTLSGIPIVADDSALKDASIDQCLDQKLSLNLPNVSLKSTLNILLKKVHLTWVIKDQILQVTTEEWARGKLKIVTYPVADLVVPVDNHEIPAISDLQKTLERITESQMGTARPASVYDGAHSMMNGTPVGTQGSAEGVGGFGALGGGGGGQPTITRRNSRTIEDQLMKLITGTVAPESWSDMGGKGTIRYYPTGLGLVVNQTQDVQEQIQDLLAALRRLQDLEVAIELRLVAVSESFYERMGVDFSLNLITHPSLAAEQMFTQGIFAPQPFVNRFTGGKFGPVGLTPAGTFTPDLNIPIKPGSFALSVPPFGGYPGTLANDGGLHIGLAFLSDIQVFMMLEMSQGDRRIHTMQAPRVTVFNGQQATLSVNTTEFFLTAIAPQFAADQLFFVPQNQPFPIGVNLQVTPVVSADRRFVRLSLNPTMTNIASTNVPLIPIQVPIPQALQDGFTNPQPVIFTLFLQQPSFETITVNTTVSVPDGGTVLLGGMKTMNEGRNEFGPPILSKIPYLNRLFKNTGYGRDAFSMMIMVTPRIIITEEEELIFQGVLPPLPRP